MSDAAAVDAFVESIDRDRYLKLRRIALANIARRARPTVGDAAAPLLCFRAMVRPEELARALVRRHERARRDADLEAERVRASLLRALADAPPPSPRRQWLIGSLAWGGFGEGSDVDLVVEGLDAAEASALTAHLIFALPVPAHVLRLEELSPSFRARVLAEGHELDVAG